MKCYSLMFAAGLALALFAGQVRAQCGASSGRQCGAPSAGSLPAAQQLTQLQLNNGLAIGNATTAAAAATSAAPQNFAAYPTVVNPAQVYMLLPTPTSTQSAQLGSSTAASASSSVPAAAAVVPPPTPIAVALNPASQSCATGQCGARGGMLTRLLRPARRSSSRSVSISRTRVR